MPEKASASHADAAHPSPDQDTPEWTPESFAPAPGQPPQLWPCWRWAYVLWQSMSTQWRSAGMSGAFVGLDYAALPTGEQRIGMPPSESKQAFAGLQIFELVQLDQWRKDEKTKAAAQGSGHD